MKEYRVILMISAGIILSCSKEKPAPLEAKYVEPHYDTTAIDSFSAGAISVDVANQIRRSSAAYQDSLKQAAAEIEKGKLEQEMKAKEAEAKSAAEKKEKEKAAKEEARKEDSKKSADQTQTQPQQNPSTN